MDPPSWLMISYPSTECSPLPHVVTLQRRRPPWSKSCPLLRGCWHSVTVGMRVWRPWTLILTGITLKDHPAPAARQPGRGLAVAAVVELGFSPSPVPLPSLSYNVNPKSTPQGPLPELASLPQSQLPGEAVHNIPLLSLKSQTLRKATHVKQSCFAPRQLWNSCKQLPTNNEHEIIFIVYI